MAHVDCKGLAAHDPFLHAARHHGLEQLAQKIALAKTSVAVLGKRRMIRDVAVEPQSTAPAIGQIEMDLLAQPTLRTNAEAVADDEHPDQRCPQSATVLHVFGLVRSATTKRWQKGRDLAGPGIW
jgi:hypothetical protein